MWTNIGTYYVRHAQSGKQSPTKKTPTSIAAFDIDHTIIKPKHNKTFPKDKDDWEVCYENIKTVFAQMNNYQLVFITNQLKFTPDIIYKIDQLNEYLSIDPVVLISTKRDYYRKPMTGLWDVLEGMFSNINKSTSLYCGDAAGRKSDFAATDYKFAHNVGIKFIIPEDFFSKPDTTLVADSALANNEYPRIYPNYKMYISPYSKLPVPNITALPVMLLLIGFPASGKSYIANKSGYIIINQDTLKTKAKCLKQTKINLTEKKNVVIDSLNYTNKMRQDYIKMAKEYNYYVHVIHITNDMELCSHMNNYRYHKSKGVKKLIPKVVFFKMRKNFEEPLLEDGINQIDKYFNNLSHNELTVDFDMYY
jgi:bifunctional polynucleotide phosphatase/kinase|tara:strand:+ start:4437 stop:5528 length:1092 start_codon:yes stop_codon:yes gene_type:complete